MRLSKDGFQRRDGSATLAKNLSDEIDRLHVVGLNIFLTYHLTAYRSRKNQITGFAKIWAA